MFNFNGADLPTIMRQLERWYNIEVKYAGKIEPREFGGELPRSLHLGDVLEILHDMKVNYTLKDRMLTIQ